MNVNGENGPDNRSLEKAMSLMRGMAREARRSRRRNRVHVAAPKVKSPRQVCAICGVLWDLAVVTGEPKPPLKSHCGDCKNMLTSGFTAFVTAKHHAWVKVGPNCGLKAGQVYKVTDAEMEVIQKRFREQADLIAYDPTEDDLNPKKHPNEFNEPGVFDVPTNAECQAVIVIEESGQCWTSQSGGFACNHPKAKGRILHPSRKLAECFNDIEKYIYEKYRGYMVNEGHFFLDKEEGDDPPDGKLMSDQDADAVDAILASSGCANELKVDRSRLKQSMEAWIYGLMDGKPCVFVMCNSD